jgi:phosphosulfolactate synthase (CoM biosynthesis protein A)
MSHQNTNSITNRLPFAHRQQKPRNKGLNYVRAPAVLGGVLRDTIDCYAPHIDIMKLSGHQASMCSESSILSAIESCHAANVRVSVGNPPIDVAMTGGRACLEKVFTTFEDWSIDLIEVSVIARSVDEDDLVTAIALAGDHGIEVILEVGVDFAHTTSGDHELFLRRRAQIASNALTAGAKYVLLESEGLTENRKGAPNRWEAVEAIIGHLDPASVIMEADDQDVMSTLIDIYGPKTNLMVDYSRIEKLEAARRGFGPSQFLWGKVASLSSDGDA